MWIRQDGNLEILAVTSDISGSRRRKRPRENVQTRRISLKIELPCVQIPYNMELKEILNFPIPNHPKVLEEIRTIPKPPRYG